MVCITWRFLRILLVQHLFKAEQKQCHVAFALLEHSTLVGKHICTFLVIGGLALYNAFLGVIGELSKRTFIEYFTNRDSRTPNSCHNQKLYTVFSLILSFRKEIKLQSFYLSIGQKIDLSQAYLLSPTVTFQAYNAKTRRASCSWFCWREGGIMVWALCR